MLTRHAGLLAALLGALASCRAPAGVVGAEPSPPARTRATSALDLAPADTRAFVTVRTLARGAEALRVLVAPLAALEQRAPERIERELREALGVALTDPGELLDAGFDPRGDGALFVGRRSLTLVARVGERGKLEQFLHERGRGETTYLRVHRGKQVYARSVGAGPGGSWWRAHLFHAGYFVLHLSGVLPPERGDDDSPARPPHSFVWLDRMLRPGSAGARDGALFRWASEAAGRRRDVLAGVDLPAVNANLTALSVRGRPRPCDDLDRDLARVRRLGLGVSVAPRSLDATLTVELDRQGAASVRRHGRPGPHLPYKLWRRAPARLAWHLDLFYLAKLVRQQGNRRCGGLHAVLAELQWLARAADRARDHVLHLGRGLSAALLSSGSVASPDSPVELTGIAVTPLHGTQTRDYFVRQINAVRTAFWNVEGRTCYRGAPATNLAQAVNLCVGAGVAAVAAGPERLAVVRPAPRRRQGQGLQLFHAAVRPSLLGDLRGPLRLLEDPLAPGRGRTRGQLRWGRELDTIASLLGAFRELSAEGVILGDTIRVEARYQLR